MSLPTVLFIQGAGPMRAPQGSGALADRLEVELRGICRVRAPEMPAPDDPHYANWRDAIAGHLASIDGPILLVGHSFGGSVLLKHLAEAPQQRSILGLFLVSVPFWGTSDWEREYALPDDFASRLPTTRMFLYHSRDDPDAPFASLRRYASELPTATVRAMEGTEHSFVDGLPALVTDIRRVVAEPRSS
jgi:predicted alpha/beta hydrolase family esterase